MSREIYVFLGILQGAVFARFLGGFSNKGMPLSQQKIGGEGRFAWYTREALEKSFFAKYGS